MKKLKDLALTSIWIGAMFLAWRAGPWNSRDVESDLDLGPHDALFHMHMPLHEGGKVSMDGQFHLELVSNKSGTHFLWISNAFRQEMDPSGFEGRISFRQEDGTTFQAPLQRDGRSKNLIAQTEPIDGQVWIAISGNLGDIKQFDDVRFFWDYSPSYEIKTPLGLDPMVPILADNRPTADKVALGRSLFFDPALSADGSVSCATCHRPEHGFAEPKAIAQGIQGRTGRRNTPTVLNTAYINRLLWDGRSATLEEQALGPIRNHAEMGVTDESALIARLTPEYDKRFRKVMGTAVTLESVAMAIASYERTLLSGDSDFDRYESGKKDAISESAQRGRSLFFGRAGCGDCHIPPLFTDMEFHNLGVAWRGDEHSDRGRFEVTRDKKDLGAFKTPSLRDVSRTPPYMHDGSIATLREVVDFYIQGGKANPSLDHRVKPLELSSAEVDELIAFLKTLDGRSYESQPAIVHTIVDASDDFGE